MVGGLSYFGPREDLGRKCATRLFVMRLKPLTLHATNYHPSSVQTRMPYRNVDWAITPHMGTPINTDSHSSSKSTIYGQGLISEDTIDKSSGHAPSSRPLYQFSRFAEILGERHMERADYFDFCRLCPLSIAPICSDVTRRAEKCADCTPTRAEC